MLRIIRNLVAIVPIENPDQIGSIIIPDMAKERLNQGFVKYRGPTTVHCKIGDYVLFSGYTGTLMHMPGEGKLIIMPEDFIVATVERIPEVEIEGLYFSDRVDYYQNTKAIEQILERIIPDLAQSQRELLAEKLTEANVYAREADPYFPATYETTMEYIASTFSNDPKWRDSLIVREMERLDPKELDKTRAT